MTRRILEVRLANVLFLDIGALSARVNCDQIHGETGLAGRPHTSPTSLISVIGALVASNIEANARPGSRLPRVRQSKTLGSGMENQISSTLPSPFYPLAVAPAEQLDSLR